MKSTGEDFRPMLAVAGALPSSGMQDWAAELKWDGVRALAFLHQGQVTLRARTGRDITATYPELAASPLAASREAVLDGEVVVFRDGVPDFEALQPRINAPSRAVRELARKAPACYVAFDALSAGGAPLARLPYRQRREALRELLPGDSRFSCPAAFPGQDAAALLAATRQQGLEGIMLKRLASPYEPGTRSANWVKVKNTYRQDFTVGGWRPGSGGRAGQPGSLLAGTWEGGALRYCGHVGTGFTARDLAELTALLAPLRTTGSPFSGPLPREHARDAIWARPELVISVQFERWTGAGLLRGPSYKGLLR